MANVFIEESTMQAIGAAIRAKTGKDEGILPADMPAEIESIEVGENPYEPELETKTTSGKIIQLHEPRMVGLPANITVAGSATQVFVCGRNWFPQTDWTFTHHNGTQPLPIQLPPGRYTIRADVSLTDTSKSKYCLIQFRSGTATNSPVAASGYIYLDGSSHTFSISQPIRAYSIYAGQTAALAQGITATINNIILTRENRAAAETYEPYRGMIINSAPTRFIIQEEHLNIITNDYNNSIVNLQYSIDLNKNIDVSTFWNIYQQNGAKTNYGYAFAGPRWTNESFMPRHDIIPSDAYMLFRESKIDGDLVDILKNLNITLDFSQCTRPQYAFCNTQFSHLGVLDFSKAANSASLSYMFQSSPSIITIDELHFNPSITSYTAGAQMFSNGITNLGYTTKDSQGNNILGGVTGIGGNKLDLSACTKLTQHSLQNILNGLVDYSQDTSGTDWVLTIGSTNLAKLEPEDIAIATQKGWTLL